MNCFLTDVDQYSKMRLKRDIIEFRNDSKMATRNDREMSSRE